VIQLTRRYRFAASHRLHSDRLSDAANLEAFGKCNNPHGHGHNYALAVSVRGPVDAASGQVVEPAALDALAVDVLREFDHRNLNAEVPEFAGAVPTAENLALVIASRLRVRWGEVAAGEWPQLAAIRIEESKRNSVTIIGNGDEPVSSGAAQLGIR
jgi:6-pyruvoyltetrahydropterin/6-carboxytetrahydropterin synthase